jgi:hypothetical protein
MDSPEAIQVKQEENHSRTDAGEREACSKTQ